LKVAPLSTRDIKEPEVRLQDKKGGDEVTIETAAAAAPRRFRINASDRTTHGYTDGCPQCGHIQRNGRGRAVGIHSDTCRDRLLTAIGDTILWRQRLDDSMEDSTGLWPSRSSEQTLSLLAVQKHCPDFPGLAMAR
jgi:hypothetical protein